MNTIKDFLDYLLKAITFWVIIQPWEQGLKIRLGKHIKLLTGGIYFKLPYFDSVYVQSVRLRVVNLPMQTVTSKDKQTVTITGNLGYQIADIEKMYKRLYHPELTLSNMAAGVLADYIVNKNVLDIDPNEISKIVVNKLKEQRNYGIGVEYFSLTNFAVVRTYRLIQDQSWVDHGVNLDQKK